MWSVRAPHPAQVYWPPTPSLYSQLPQPSASTLPELTLDAGFPLPATRRSASTAPELALDGRLPLPAAGVSTLGTGGLGRAALQGGASGGPAAARLGTGGLGAAALQGGASGGPAGARLAFFTCSFLPMVGGWPRASR